MKTRIPLLVAFITGFIMVVKEFIPHPLINIPADKLTYYGMIIMSSMTVLGVINIFQVNIPKIIKRQKDWGYKVVMLVSLLFTALIGVVFGPFDRIDTGAYALFNYVMRPLQSTMFALLAFFIASAAFRAFRARTFEATLLLLAAIIVMLGRVPLGEYFIGGLPDLVEWINNVPNLAAKRAIIMGAALGAISTSIRVILGLERSYLSR
ncbi:MAG: hypothetical protein Kow0090_05270 [Myxococcota bacterium]